MCPVTVSCGVRCCILCMKIKSSGTFSPSQKGILPLDNCLLQFGYLASAIAPEPVCLWPVKPKQNAKLKREIILARLHCYHGVFLHYLVCKYSVKTENIFYEMTDMK